MLKSRIAFSVLSVALLAGCSQPPAEVSVAEQFWSALEAGNYQALAQTLTEPQLADQLEGFGWMGKNWRLEGVVDEGVKVVLSSKCYEDYSHTTVISEVAGEPRVDFRKTMAAGAKAEKDKTPKSQYCYNFADQPLQGTLNGQPWVAHHVNRAVYDFGTKKEEQLKVVAEACEDQWCNGLKSPALLVSNLDLSGTGGNFDMQSNVTVFTPPDNNKIVTEGSYRLSRTPGGQTKLEISFPEDEGHALTGYVIY